jgi:hypothetical protein
MRTLTIARGSRNRWQHLAFTALFVIVVARTGQAGNITLNASHL